MWLKYRKHAPEILIGLLFSAVLIVALLTPPNPVESIMSHADMALYDLRIRLGEGFSSTETPEPPIVIVDIDEHTQQQEGRWPWSRHQTASLIQHIGEQEPSLIVLDELFGSTEPVQQTACNANDFCPLTPPPDPTAADRELAEAIAGQDVILGFLFHQEYVSNGTLPPSNKAVTANALKLWEARGYSTSLAPLQQALFRSGHMNTLLATDGSARRIPLFLQYGGHLYPSLTLAAAQRFLLEKDWQVHTASLDKLTLYTGIGLGSRYIATNPMGEILIPYARETHFPVISATDIMRGKTNPHALEGAIVLVGSSALLQGDLKNTPLQANMPGITIHAFVLQGLLHPEILLHEPAWDLTLELIGLLALALLMLSLYPLCPPRALLLSGITLTLVVIAANVWMWHGEHVRLDMVPALALIFGVTTLFVIFDLLQESRDRQRLQHLFGQYVPPEHIRQMLAKPDSLTLDGEKREMTVLFADLHDFTSIAERLDTQVLKNLLNRYLNAVTNIIFEQNGTVDKYIGDMVMAFWNAPLREPKHARQAVLCSLNLRRMLTENAAEYREFGITPLQLGIGINSGDMNVGDMGSDHRRAYTVLGDAVNLASRIESLTRFYGVDILVSEHTRKQCKGITFRTIDRVRVKGKRETVLLYQPLGLSIDLTPPLQNLWNMHERAMDAYWKQDWPHASKLFARILVEYPEEHLAGMYLQRIARLMQKTPPPDWDGVYEHRRK